MLPQYGSCLLFTSLTLPTVAHNSQVTVTQDVYVRDLLTVVVTQPNGPGTATTAVDTYVPNALTTKDCTSQADGKCNILTQLPSKYFVDAAPQDLRVSGTAVLAFGSVRNRVLHVPVSNLRAMAPSHEGEDRQLQQGGESQSEFDLTTKLQGSPAAPETNDDGGSDTTLMVICIAVGVIALVALGCGWYYCAGSKRKQAT
jgi:hypothetical protein